MRKTLLLLAFMAIVCIGCKDNSKNNGLDTPETPEEPDKPKLGYIDFANWGQIYLKDVATAQPKIKGTLASDKVNSQGGRELVYKHDSDGGMVTTYYVFNKKGLLDVISARIEGDALRNPVDRLTKHTKAIASELHSFVYSVKNGENASVTFDNHQDDKLVRWIDSNRLYPSEMHSVLWQSIDRYFKNEIPDNEGYRFEEFWKITDDVEHPDSTTPYISFSLQTSFKPYYDGGANAISVLVRRHAYFVKSKK